MNVVNRACSLQGRIVEAVLLWIAENAPVPTQDQLSKIPTSPCGRYDWPICLVEEWERRMFLAKGSKVPNYKRLNMTSTLTSTERQEILAGGSSTGL